MASNSENMIQNNTIENADNSSVSTSSEVEENKPINFTLTAIGDTLCHNTQYWDAYNSETDEYDFSYVYEDIKNYTLSSDITIGSLETTFAGKEKGYSNYPTFNTPDSLATALKDIGVDVVSLAGNHALDYGYTGLCRTIDVFNNIGLSHLGTYKTAEDQEKILIKDVKGVKIAFINYTYGTNGIPLPSGKEFCVNLIDKDFIKKQINQAKEQNVDMIVACMHWGTEYRTTANSEQKYLANFLFENGVDVILGNHPHVLEPMEKKTITLQDGTTKDVFVVYALGNFTADQRDEITRDSAILNLTITKNSDGKISIDKVNYVPIYMYKNTNVSTHKFKILDIEKTIKDSNLTIDKSKIFFDEPMKKHTTFKIGGPAECLIKINDINDLKQILKFANDNDIKITVLGNGSNVLVSDKGIKGITLMIQLEEIHIQDNKESIKVTVGAGEKIGKLARKFLKNEITGFEELSGIPGTIGGAVRMNAGAHGKEMKDIIKTVKCMDKKANEKVLTNQEMKFGYRRSILKEQEYIITQVELELKKGKKEQIEEKMKEYFEFRKEKQPIEFPSAGSTFKRGEDFITAKLIDMAGLKGYCIGGAEVSTKHSGFIINKSNATSQDVLDLAKHIENEVYKRFNKKIELEIEVIGE